MKVEVRPIETKKWHKKIGKESFKRPIKISALVDPNTMEYATGLDEKEAKEYGSKLKQDLSAVFNPEIPHSFWDSKMAVVKLENNTMFFDTDIPIKFVIVKMLKASKYVANSLKEYQEGLYPYATHVIFDEAEEVEVKASKVALHNKAVIECSKLSRDRKVQMILILAGKNLKGKSEDFVEVELSELVESQTEVVLRFITRDKEETYLEGKHWSSCRRIHRGGNRRRNMDCIKRSKSP